MLRWLIGIILGEIICKFSNWQHIQRVKITLLGANWQLFRLERIAKCSYFNLSTQNIKFYWLVMKIKKVLLPIWWYKRGYFLLGIIFRGLRSDWARSVFQWQTSQILALIPRVYAMVRNCIESIDLQKWNGRRSLLEPTSCTSANQLCAFISAGCVHVWLTVTIVHSLCLKYF